MPKLFISYRRKDAADVTGRLNDRLKSHFGDESVFLDIDSIPIGLDFRKELSDAVSECDVLLAVIGPNWLDVKYEDGPDQGRRRLENPNDYVRIEIQAALSRGIPVVPVLVGDAKMPTEAELPDDIKELAFRNAAVVRSQEDFHSHVDRVIRGLEKLVQSNREFKAGMQQASDLAGKYPDLAVHSAGKLIESVVREIYERRFNEPAGARPLRTLVERLIKAGYFPERFGDAVASQANQSLPQLMEVLQWYVNTERPDALGDLPAKAAASSAATPSVFSSKAAIIPKGLRSFDAHDADFFLDLLPGPRDKDGLPESISFWRYRIENREETTFTVGLIYGPSGCGKSSLVKAGLLPRLSGEVIVVHVEATPEETESRLLNGLRKRCPNLQQQLGLKETLVAMHQNEGTPAGRKVLIVLDQFEQWLHAKRSADSTELVEALRQCDGSQVQCIVMVRDDFWMAVTRFFQALDIPLVEAQNSKAVDLFPLWHARQVLAAFGRAYGGLPAETGNGSGEQKQFLDQATAGLSEDGKVICVRLALFAEMMKGKSWTPATLKEVGGTEGVGVTFLEETFSATTAPPDRRFHQKAARSVLKALLPESGTDIKGHMRSYRELLEASGYADRPKDFAELVRILDSDVRLITPTDPEGKETADGSTPTLKAGEKYYQLTHDYLVPSLREWLSRKQRETRKGRAELRLAERAAVWNAKPENRHLPSLWEYLNIRSLTGRRNWTGPQQTMMGRAGRVHAVRSVVASAVFFVILLTGLVVSRQIEEKRQADYATALVEQLIKADITKVREVVEKLAGYRRWADPLLRTAYDDHPADSPERLKAALALLPVDPEQADFLRERLLKSDPPTLKVVRDELDRAGYRQASIAPLWAVLGDQRAAASERFRGSDPDTVASERFNAACALATYDPSESGRGAEQWLKVSSFVADRLVLTLLQDPSHYTLVLEFLRPAKTHLLAPLAAIFRNPDHSDSERAMATTVLADYAADQPTQLAALVMDADAKQFAILYPVLAKHDMTAVKLLNDELARKLSDDPNDPRNEVLAKRQANAAAALVRLGAAGQVWPLFKHPGDEKHFGDPRVRSYVVDRLGPLGCDPQAVIARFDHEQDVSARRALILTLGQFGTDKLPEAARLPLVEKFAALYRDDPDRGIHGACEWLLRTWGQGERIAKIDEQLRGQPADKKLWYVNGQGQTLAIVRGPVEFTIGSPPAEPDREGGAEGKAERQHRKSIERSFAIATHEVTLAEFTNPAFLSFRAKHTATTYEPGVQYLTPEGKLDRRCPANAMTWYDAAAYCNWLSDVEGIKEAQWCYESIAEGANKGKFAVGMKLADDYLHRTGYRLPSEAEWEYACRALSSTSRYYGQTEMLLPDYAWYTANSLNRWMLPVGSLLPNDLGMFDMLGNANEWCQEISYVSYREGADGEFHDGAIENDSPRVLRGGSFNNRPSIVRSADRYRDRPSIQNYLNGFRPARTYP